MVSIFWLTFLTDSLELYLPFYSFSLNKTQFSVAKNVLFFIIGRFLIKNNRVDSTCVCIVGDSAGGFTALNVLLHPEKVFAAAVSQHSVYDLEDFYKVCAAA